MPSSTAVDQNIHINVSVLNVLGHSVLEERSHCIPEPKFAHRVSKDGTLGSQLTMWEIFNRLFAVKKNREYRKNDPANPIIPEMFCGSLLFVRF